jgi:chromosome partitioning protein
MRTIAIAGGKGGCGKTSAVLLLAVHAVVSLRMRVALMDANSDQPGIDQWLEARSAQGDLFAPELIEIENLAQDVKVLAHAGAHDLLLIDCPPGIDDSGIMEAAVASSDCVIVPCRPSMLDVGTMDVMVEICREHNKPFAFLLSDVTETWKAINNTSIAALSDMGPVLAARITHQPAYVNALTAGRVGFEINKALKPEVVALWSEVARLAKIDAPTKPAGTPLKRGRRHG